MEFLDENIQQGIKKGLKSMTHILYNEMYIYVWFICIYHVILVIIVLTNLVLLVKVSTRSSAFSFQHPFSSFVPFSSVTTPSSFFPTGYSQTHFNVNNNASSLETLNLEDLEKMALGLM
jgi:hypothetical protein